MGVPNINSSSDSKCNKWSLGKDVQNNPPLLEDMGLSPLQQFESDISVNCNIPEAVVSTSQKRDFSIYNFQNNEKSEDFFVFKRRKIDAISGEDKFNKLTEEVVLMVFQWLPKFMLARCAQVCKRWKRLAFDETLWRKLDLGAKTLNPGVVGRVLQRGTYFLRLAKAEISSPIFCPNFIIFQPTHK
ncbi:S-phase kinase-associated protein 2 [Armadillidium nasatum]|uniref:S-phase kinase-associated protein 2 n=1 Tax=Armadillidium nasatum TaxID=96803 RepID=A0A5N5SV94_9CRUS|nr:S-phase kinase-associated protein 2 [Armadillidium nasatum]